MGEGDDDHIAHLVGLSHAEVVIFLLWGAVSCQKPTTKSQLDWSGGRRFRSLAVHRGSVGDDRKKVSVFPLGC